MNFKNPNFTTHPQDMIEACPKDDVKLPDGWEWTSDWHVDVNDEPGDVNG